MKFIPTAVKEIIERSIRALVLLACPLLSPASVQAEVSLMVYDFELGPNPASNVDYVQSLGFRGLVTRCSIPTDVAKLANYANRAATIRPFQILAYVDYDFNNPDSPQVWRDALPILARANAPLWVIVKNAPSTTAIHALLLQMATRSQLLGVRTVIYPHWRTDIENAAEAAAHIAQIGHANLSNSLHTCHEIRSGNQYNMAAVVAAHASTSELVTIAGADDNAYSGPPPPGFLPWDDAIKPLDQGRYSLLPFLQALHSAGYDGPVILHTFGIVNDPGHLDRSIRGYADYRAKLQ